LRKRSEISVVGISRDTKAISNEIGESNCEVVLTDCFSTESHTSLLSDLLNQNADVKILLFGMDEDPEIFLEAVQLGIRGYVLKDASAAEIIAAVRAVARGEASCPPRLCLTLIQHVASEYRLRPKTGTGAGTDKNSLTHRQLQLMYPVAQGLTNTGNCRQPEPVGYGEESHPAGDETDGAEAATKPSPDRATGHLVAQ
jgi:DNA-binding NarL/FixJ family response regulator